MSKNDRIDELTERCQAQDSLLRSIAELLGVAVGDDVHRRNLPRYMARFSEAIHKLKDGVNEEDRDGEALSGQGYNTFDDLVDEEVDRMKAKGLTVPRGSVDKAKRVGQSVALATPASSGGDAREAIDNIANELGIDVADLTGADAVHAIHREFLKLKNPSADIAPDAAGPLSKGDTLAQAWAHVTSENRSTMEGLTKARMLINRIASAMHLSQWDEDGTEILERIQRWETIRFSLKKRLEQLPIDSQAHQEVRALFAQIVSSKEFAAWVANKPKATLSPAVMQIAESGPSGAGEAQAEQRDAGEICRSLANDPRFKESRLHTLFERIAATPTAAAELARLINVIITPMLLRNPSIPSRN